MTCTGAPPPQKPRTLMPTTGHGLQLERGIDKENVSPSNSQELNCRKMPGASPAPSLQEVLSPSIESNKQAVPEEATPPPATYKLQVHTKPFTPRSQLDLSLTEQLVSQEDTTHVRTEEQSLPKHDEVQNEADSKPWEKILRNQSLDQSPALWEEDALHQSIYWQEEGSPVSLVPTKQERLDELGETFLVWTNPLYGEQTEDSIRSRNRPCQDWVTAAKGKAREYTVEGNSLPLTSQAQSESKESYKGNAHMTTQQETLEPTKESPCNSTRSLNPNAALFRSQTDLQDHFPYEIRQRRRRQSSVSSWSANNTPTGIWQNSWFSSTPSEEFQTSDQDYVGKRGRTSPSASDFSKDCSVQKHHSFADQVDHVSSGPNQMDESVNQHHADTQSNQLSRMIRAQQRLRKSFTSNSTSIQGTLITSRQQATAPSGPEFNSCMRPMILAPPTRIPDQMQQVQPVQSNLPVQYILPTVPDMRVEVEEEIGCPPGFESHRRKPASSTAQHLYSDASLAGCYNIQVRLDHVL